ncbi:MAG: DNA polymerase III subunit delta' [Spirosomaceae bacterium]|nr:DNA polymerase III subunit delta' [Spirosomataceae bacterium]
MQFSQIPGLHSLKSSLMKAVEKNHFAHAQLIHGHEGNGNLAIALALATYLNCQNRQATDSCGACSSCVKMSKVAHPDVKYIYPTAGGKKVLSANFIEQWRDFVQTKPFGNLSDWLEAIDVKQGNIPVEEARLLIQDLSMKSYEGGYKIVLIWQAESLHTATANALLKVLEEPPEQTIFLLVTNSTEQLLTTIISRTQRVWIPDFTDEDIENYLVDKLTVTTERAKQATFLSQNNLRNALHILESDTPENHQLFAEWMRKCYSAQLDELVLMSNEFDKKTKEQHKNFFEYGISIFRELFLYAKGNEDLVRLVGDELIFVQRFSKALNFRNLEKITTLLGDASYHIARNGRAKIIFLDLSLTLAGLLKK